MGRSDFLLAETIQSKGWWNVLARRSRCARQAPSASNALPAEARRQVASENGQVGRSTQIQLSLSSLGMIWFWRTAPIRLSNGCLLLAALLLIQLCFTVSAAAGNDLSVQLERGKELYIKNCFVCHQITGQGIPGAFPPLAKSDYLTNDVERGIRAVCEGLSGEIVVNGRKFAGAMPPAVIDDAEVADLFTYVLNSWGNPGGEVSADTVRQVRAKTAFPTLEALKKSSTYPPLPIPPDGFTLREVVRLPHKGVRLASDGEGKILFVLTEQGDVWRLEPENGSLRQVLWAKRYLEKRPGDIGGPLFVLGMAMDKQKRLHIASNQQNKDTLPPQNIVTIYRTTSALEGDPAEPKPWFQTNYPGSPAYIHGVEHIAFGPDGFLYVGNGARTDGGLTSTDTNWYGGGEDTHHVVPLAHRSQGRTAHARNLRARGIRNAYGFCWNDRGEMFATENGPDADAPEELNFIERGRHYGFPYTFANWTKSLRGHAGSAAWADVHTADSESWPGRRIRRRADLFLRPTLRPGRDCVPRRRFSRRLSRNFSADTLREFHPHAEGQRRLRRAAGEAHAKCRRRLRGPHPHRARPARAPDRHPSRWARQGLHLRIFPANDQFGFLRAARTNP